jgi:hypothetical protein
MYLVIEIVHIGPNVNQVLTKTAACVYKESAATDIAKQLLAAISPDQEKAGWKTAFYVIPIGYGEGEFIVDDYQLHLDLDGYADKYNIRPHVKKLLTFERQRVIGFLHIQQDFLNDDEPPFANAAIKWGRSTVELNVKCDCGHALKEVKTAGTGQPPVFCCHDCDKNFHLGSFVKLFPISYTERGRLEDLGAPTEYFPSYDSR